jgi:hypothetical protein
MEHVPTLSRIPAPKRHCCERCREPGRSASNGGSSSGGSGSRAASPRIPTMKLSQLLNSGLGQPGDTTKISAVDKGLTDIDRVPERYHSVEVSKNNMPHPLCVFSGCPNQALGWPFLFRDL